MAISPATPELASPEEIVMPPELATPPPVVKETGPLEETPPAEETETSPLAPVELPPERMRTSPPAA
jgi:hypothetical protein